MKKGYTYIELLSVLTIISSIALVSIESLNNDVIPLVDQTVQKIETELKEKDQEQNKILDLLKKVNK